jgi:general secretion pathway protein G
MDKFTRATRPGARGFTLMELLIVVVIVGLLVALVGPRFFGQLSKSKQQTTRAQIESFRKALDAYRLDVGRYPTPEQGLEALRRRPGTEAKWNGPYLDKDVPLDPWGKPYVYRPSADGKEVELTSYGEDGAPGGQGEAADIRN